MFVRRNLNRISNKQEVLFNVSSCARERRVYPSCENVRQEISPECAFRNSCFGRLKGPLVGHIHKEPSYMGITIRLIRFIGRSCKLYCTSPLAAIRLPSCEKAHPVTGNLVAFLTSLNLITVFCLVVSFTFHSRIVLSAADVINVSGSVG